MTTQLKDEHIEVEADFTVPYTMIQNEVMDCMSFEKPLDKMVYCCLLRFAFHKGVAYPSVKKLAFMCSVSENPIRDAIKRLVKLGLVVVKSRKNDKSESLPNLYTIRQLTDEMKANSVSDPEVYAKAIENDRERKKAKFEEKKLSTLSTESTGTSDLEVGTSDSEPRLGTSDLEVHPSDLEVHPSESEDKEEVFKKKSLKDLKDINIYNKQPSDSFNPFDAFKDILNN